MSKLLSTLLVTAIIFLLMVSAGASVLFSFTDNYKLELWALILTIIAVKLSKKEESNNVSVIIPDNAVQVHVNLSGTSSSESFSAVTNTPKLPDIEIDAKSIPKWKDVKVGEVSLNGEKL